MCFEAMRKAWGYGCIGVNDYELSLMNDILFEYPDRKKSNPPG